jgi:hypothetical protein
MRHAFVAAMDPGNFSRKMYSGFLGIEGDQMYPVVAEYPKELSTPA